VNPEVSVPDAISKLSKKSQILGKKKKYVKRISQRSRLRRKRHIRDVFSRSILYKLGTKKLQK
jgi:GTPase Era involved in 16S rRNA processing